MATEAFTNFPATTVPAGADGNSGSEMWIVSSSGGFPTASTGVTQFHVADTNQAASSELILVTNMTGTDNTTWAVTRGAEGTNPVSHEPGFTVTAVITAGWLNAVSGTTLPEGTPGALLYTSPASAAAWLGGPTTSTKEFLTSTGTGGTANTPAWGTITSADVPNPLNQNTTGTSANVTGTVATINGGTGLGSLTMYAVLTGGTSSTSPVQQVAGAGTAGQVLTSSGAGVLPSWQPATGGGGTVAFPIPVSEGGTGGTAVTAYAVVTGGTASSTPLQQVSGLGAPGYVLTSQGAGSLPSFQAIPAGGTATAGILQLDGTAGHIANLGTVASAGTLPTAAAADHVHAWGQAAPAGFAPANPASSTSATLVMMGLGSTCAYTPASSGIVLVNVTGYAATASGVANMQAGLRYGSGSAPSNGGTVTGTRFGGVGDPSPLRSQTAGAPVAFAATALLSLPPSTAYWFDVAISTGNSSDAVSVTNVGMTFAEFP